MERPFLIDKPLGATPLQALELFRQARSIVPATKLAYAGRLDPLASGLLPVLSGEMLQHQEEYWHLPKQYEAALLLGVCTDSYDLLGIPTITGAPAPGPDRITAVVRGMVGKFDLSVPVFSSYRVSGKPLFAWAREAEEPLPDVPVKRMSVNQIDVTGTSEIRMEELGDTVRRRIGLVRGDFRQDDSLAAWQQCLADDGFLPVIQLSIQCASGTYVRSIANEIGKRLGCGAVVAELRRVRVGPWRITDPDVVGLVWPR